MKRGLLFGLIMLLAAFGVYCGWRYYSDVFLPNRQITEALVAQNAMFEELKPDYNALMQQAASDSVQSQTQAQPAPPETEAISAALETDPLAGLRAVNRETVGWLTIAGTSVDYPIVQATDNSFYLKNGFDRQPNQGLGCPFLDSRCAPRFDGFNSIVYAHYIPGKQELFADIANYRDSAFLQRHRYGVLLTQDGVHQVRFFAYLTVPSDSFAYCTLFETKADRDTYLDALFSHATYTLQQTAADLKDCETLHLLLLSTCTYEYSEARGVLVGVIE